MARAWHQVGQIRFQQDGSPVLVPFPDSVFLGEKSPYSLTKTFEEGLNTWLFDNVCDLGGRMEAGYRALGLLGNASSMLAARNSAGCRGVNPGSATVDPGSPLFTGGQCPVNYNGSITRRFQNGATGPFTMSSPILGPIAGLRPIPAGFGSYSVEYQRGTNGPWLPVPGGGTVSSINRIVAVLGASFTRADGLPDNCGSLPGQPSLPPPDPLPPVPSIGEIMINPQWVDVDIDDRDNNIKFSLPIGAVVFGGVTGAEFNVGDIPIRILPDWQVQVGSGSDDDGDGSPSLPPSGSDSALVQIAREIDQFDVRLLQQLEDMERDLEVIGEGLSSLSAPIEGTFSALDCEGAVLEFPFAGRGIVGVASMVNAGVIALQQTPAIVCDQEGEGPLGPLELAIAGSVEGAFESRVIAFGQDVRRVVLVVDPGTNADIYRFDNQLTMGKFGWWGVGPIYDGVPTPISWQQVTLTQQAFDVTERGWGLRLTLNRGVGYSVFVQEV